MRKITIKVRSRCRGRKQKERDCAKKKRHFVGECYRGGLQDLAGQFQFREYSGGSVKGLIP